MLTGPDDNWSCPSDLALGDFGECGPLELLYRADGSVSHGGAAIALAPEVHAAITAAQAMSPTGSVTISYAKNDEWAVGWVSFQMCTGGSPPFAGDPPYSQEDRAAIPSSVLSCHGGLLGHVLDGLTKVDPNARLSAEQAYLLMLQVFASEE